MVVENGVYQWRPMKNTWGLIMRKLGEKLIGIEEEKDRYRTYIERHG